MIGERKWYLVSSYEDATILIDNCKTNTVTNSQEEVVAFERGMHNYD